MKIGGKYSESFYQREQTNIVLEAFAKPIILRRRPEWEDDGAGGSIRPDETPINITVQRLWFHESAPIAHVARGTNYQETIGMGQRAITNYVLLGKHDADIKQDDEFDIGEYAYRVSYVHPDRDFQTIAEVERITDAEG